MTRKARKVYSADFETTTDVNDCRVWAYGYCEIGNKQNRKIGNNINEFMAFLENECPKVYFHNLKFDGEFIVNWLLLNGYKHSEHEEPRTFSCMISNMAQWYKVKITFSHEGTGRKRQAIIQDSLKKLPFKVSQIAKDFNLSILKGNIDYHAYRPVGHELTKEEKEYLDNDIDIVADAMETQFDQGLLKMTNGSDALSEYESIIGEKAFKKYFPVFNLRLNDKIRYAYRGGFTWLHERFKEKDIGEGLVFDVNSLYPSVMYDRQLPWGMPIPYKGKYKPDRMYPLYIQHIRIDFELKEGKIPTIQLKKTRFPANEYLKTSEGEIVDLYVTNIDLDMILDHYDVHYMEYVEGWKFRQKTGLFKDYIDKWTYIKINSTGAKKLLAKLMLNSLYGKFATNPNITGKVPYLKPDGSTGFRLEGDPYEVMEGDTLDTISKRLDIEKKDIVELNKWLKRTEMGQGDIIQLPKFRDPIYTPMGVFITSYARQLTISTAQQCYSRIIYCDTDSIHLTGTDIPESIKELIHDKNLGMWAWEGTFKRARYIRQKTYMYELYGKHFVNKFGENDFKATTIEEAEGTKEKVVCAGMTDEIKQNVTFENFYTGFTSFGKKRPVHVRGGVVLEDSEFTIK